MNTLAMNSGSSSFKNTLSKLLHPLPEVLPPLAWGAKIGMSASPAAPNQRDNKSALKKHGMAPNMVSLLGANP